MNFYPSTHSATLGPQHLTLLQPTLLQPTLLQPTLWPLQPNNQPDSRTPGGCPHILATVSTGPSDARRAAGPHSEEGNDRIHPGSSNRPDSGAAAALCSPLLRPPEGGLRRAGLFAMGEFP
ncbi:unnamed protein product [Boreogadus saida]